MFTALRRLAIPGQRLPFVQYVVSLAVVQAVQAEAAARLQVRRRTRAVAWKLAGAPSRRAAPTPPACRALRLRKQPRGPHPPARAPASTPYPALPRPAPCPPRPDLPRQGGGVDVRIKWPNDLYAGGLKLGGILCHSSYRDGRFYVVMGVGLNLSNRQPTTCVDALIEAAAAAARAGDAGGGEARQQRQQAQAQQAQEAQQAQQQQGRQQGQQAPAVPPVSREALLAGVLSRLEPMLERLAADGFSPFEADYCANWLHSEQQARCAGCWPGRGGRGRARPWPRCRRAGACRWLRPVPAPRRASLPPSCLRTPRPPTNHQPHQLSLAHQPAPCRCCWRRAGSASR